LTIIREEGDSMRRVLAVLLVLSSTLLLADCRRAHEKGRVLALGLAVFSKSPEGKQVPGEATAGFLAPGSTWRHGTLKGATSSTSCSSTARDRTTAAS
jgi:hypothetical protein